MRIRTIVVIAVVLGVIGLLVTWASDSVYKSFFRTSTAGRVQVRESYAIDLEPFVVNLAGAGSQHFLRVKMAILVPAGEFAKSPVDYGDVRVLRVRSAILDLLTKQAADSLVTSEGKIELKKAVAETAGRELGIEVQEVVFSEFIVQF